MWRGSAGLHIRWPTLSVASVSLAYRAPFSTPLIKPDVQFSRIRLSDNDSHFRPRQAVCQQGPMHQPQRLVEVCAPVMCAKEWFSRKRILPLKRRILYAEKADRAPVKKSFFILRRYCGE
jgi:hypothetical protein